MHVLAIGSPDFSFTFNLGEPAFKLNIESRSTMMIVHYMKL